MTKKEAANLHSDVLTHSSAELVAMHNRLLPGKPVKRFSSLAVARRRVSALLVAARQAESTSGKGRVASAPADPKRAKPKFVCALPTGTTVLQKGSARRAVFDATLSLMTRKKVARVPVSEVEVLVGFPLGSHLVKLRKAGHVSTHETESN